MPTLAPITDSLHALGVRDDTLTVEEKAVLDENGYLVLGDLFTDRVEQMRARLEAIAEAEGEEAGRELRAGDGHVKFKKDVGAVRLSDLVNKDPMFEICYTHPRVLAAMAHVLGPSFQLSSLNGRFARPGHGHQPLHVDWGEAVEPGGYLVCNSIWLIDTFTPENGATRVVPGSHRWGLTPEQGMDDPADPHPEEVLLLGEAGTVVVFNAHTWHGGTQNRTDHPRRAMHSYYCRRDQQQQIDQRRYLRPETRARLSPEALTVLGVE